MSKGQDPAETRSSSVTLESVYRKPGSVIDRTIARIASMKRIATTTLAGRMNSPVRTSIASNSFGFATPTTTAGMVVTRRIATLQNASHRISRVPNFIVFPHVGNATVTPIVPIMPMKKVARISKITNGQALAMRRNSIAKTISRVYTKLGFAMGIKIVLMVRTNHQHDVIM